MKNILLAVAALLFSSFAFAQDYPTAQSLGIDVKKITIVRDNFGVPHIYAKTNPEAAYGLGWASCEDEFHDLQELLLIVKRKMGEIKGKDGAAMDFFTQFIRAEEQVPANFMQQLSPDFIAYQNAYVAAVNDFAAAHPKEVRAKGLFPVTLKEVLTGYVVVFASAAYVPRAIQAIMEGRPDKFYYKKAEGKGSNGMAFSSLKTQDGKTYLVINPHLPIDGASSFYECHLHTEEGLDIHGATFPGASAPGLGVTQNLGWTHTSNWPDCVDVYRLTLDPKNKDRYRYDGQWKTLEKREAKLRVKVAGVMINVKREILWCEYGPAIRMKDGVFALRYSVRNAWRAGEEWYKRCLAKNLKEFQEAMKLHAITNFNTIYADKEDNIFFFFGSNIPKRNPAYNWQACLLGDTSATCHQEIYELEELPFTFNPRCGYVYNTNNTPLKSTCDAENIPQDRYPHTMGLWWNHENNRDYRFRELIAQYDRVTEDDIRKIKNDPCYPRNPQAPIYQVVNALRSLKAEQYPDVSDAIKHIQNWDLCGQADNRHAALSLMVFYDIFRKNKYGFAEVESGFTPQTEEIIAAARRIKKLFLKVYGKLDPALGEVQQLFRGKKTFPVFGLPEVLAPMYSEETPDGKLKVELGENYIGYARFGKNGLEKYETIVPFGACGREGDPHYDDQAALFSTQKTKPVELDSQAPLNNPAYKKYHPGDAAGR